MISSVSENKANLTSTVESISIPNTKVYVCFLPPSMNEDTLLKMFQKFGSIQSSKLRKRKDGFTYSYITYRKLQEAQKAIHQMNKFPLEDKKLKVNFATQVEKKPRQDQKKQFNEKEVESNEKQVKSFADLLVQKMPSKKSSKKKKKKEKKQTQLSKKVQQEKKDLTKKQENEKKLKMSKKPLKQTLQQKTLQLQETKPVKQILETLGFEIKQLDDQEDTEAQWSQEFDPAQLKKKPYLTFTL